MGLEREMKKKIKNKNKKRTRVRGARRIKKVEREKKEKKREIIRVFCRLLEGGSFGLDRYFITGYSLRCCDAIRFISCATY